MIHECTIQSGCARPSASRPQGAGENWVPNLVWERDWSKVKVQVIPCACVFFLLLRTQTNILQADGCSFSPSAVAEARSLIAFTTAFRISHTWNKSYSTRSVSYKHNSFKGFWIRNQQPKKLARICHRSLSWQGMRCKLVHLRQFLIGDFPWNSRIFIGKETTSSCFGSTLHLQINT